MVISATPITTLEAGGNSQAAVMPVPLLEQWICAVRAQEGDTSALSNPAMGEVRPVTHMNDVDDEQESGGGGRADCGQAVVPLTSTDPITPVFAPASPYGVPWWRWWADVRPSRPLEPAVLLPIAATSSHCSEPGSTRLGSSADARRLPAGPPPGAPAVPGMEQGVCVLGSSARQASNG